MTGMSWIRKSQSVQVQECTSNDILVTLSEYETKYRMTSQEFRKRWSTRKLDHGNSDFASWELLLGVYDAARSSEKATGSSL